QSHIYCTVLHARRIGGISDLRAAQSSMRRGLACLADPTRRVSRAEIGCYVLAGDGTLRGKRSLGPTRSVGLDPQPVLWFGRVERGRRRSFYGRRFYRSLDDFKSVVSLRCKRGLDVRDRGFKLLVRQFLEQIAVFDLVLARGQQRQDFEVRGRL